MPNCSPADPAGGSHARSQAGDLLLGAVRSGGSLGQRLGVTEADVDGQVGEDVRHLGAVAQSHRGADEIVSRGQKRLRVIGRLRNESLSRAMIAVRLLNLLNIAAAGVGRRRDQRQGDDQPRANKMADHFFGSHL